MSKKRKLKRCKLIVDGVRCNLDATHGLYDETGKRVKGTALCEKHARQYIAAHSRWSNLTWTAEPFDPRAGSSYQSSPELEAQITGAREYAADIIGHGFGADDDMTVELAVELVEKDKRIAELEAERDAAVAAHNILRDKADIAITRIEDKFNRLQERVHDLVNSGRYKQERIAELVTKAMESRVRIVKKDRRIAELEAMLVQLEWCQRETMFYSRLCPICGATHLHGHGPDCELAALLHKGATNELEA